MHGHGSEFAVCQCRQPLGSEGSHVREMRDHLVTFHWVVLFGVGGGRTAEIGHELFNRGREPRKQILGHAFPLCVDPEPAPVRHGASARLIG